MNRSRVRPVLVALIAFAAVGAGARQAWAFACVTTTCAKYCETPVPYRLAKISDDLGADATKVELQRGMEAWTKPACSSLKTQFRGTTTEAAASGNGVVSWIESGWSSGSGTIGVTTSRASRGCITGSMVMNGVNFRWVAGAPKSRGEVNAFTIIAHEAGHYLGLGHSNMTSAIMTPSYSGGVGSLSDDDQAGICKIYPGGGGGTIPATGAGGTSGSGGSAGAGGNSGAGGSPGAGGSGGTAGGAPVGTGALCAVCKVAADCASGVCLRNDNTGELFCGQACGAGCPAGFSCTTVNGTQASRQCAPTGGSCQGLAPMPMPGSGGVGGNAGSGGSGGEPSDGTGGSPTGEGGAGPVEEERITLSDGEHCEVNEDCHSQLCLEQNKDTFCSRLCETNADCVSGFACRAQGDDRVCLPIDSSSASDDDKTASGGKVIGGCAMAGGADQPSGAWLLLAVGFAWLFGSTRKRRRESQSTTVQAAALLSFLAALSILGCGVDSGGTGDQENGDDPPQEGGSGAGAPQEGGSGAGDESGGGQAAAGGNAMTPLPSGTGGMTVSPPSAGNGGAPAPTPAPTPPPTPSSGTPGNCSVTQTGGSGKEPGGSIPVCCTPAAADKVLIDEVFSLLNAHRAANGRSALAQDPKLEQAMQGHCQHMTEHSFFAHQAPETTVSSFGTRASLCGAKASGENIAYNQRSPAQVMTSWKNSAGHNANMLNSGYRRVGIGEFQLRWGQIFGR